MARNGSGIMSLVSGNPVVAGTKALASWANSTLGDIATEISNSLDRAGRSAMTAALRLVAGTAAAPGLTFDGDTDTGLFRAGANDLRATAGGVEVLNLTTAGSRLTAVEAAAAAAVAQQGKVRTFAAFDFVTSSDAVDYTTYFTVPCTSGRRYKFTGQIHHTMSGTPTDYDIEHEVDPFWQQILFDHASTGVYVIRQNMGTTPPHTFNVHAVITVFGVVLGTGENIVFKFRPQVAGNILGVALRWLQVEDITP